MRCSVVIIVSLLALDLSQAFSQFSSIGRRHWQHWSSSTKLDFSSSIGEVDPTLLPALTASASLFFGAAGTLLYNRLAAEQKKQEPLPPSATTNSDVKQLQANLESVIPSLEEQAKAQEELEEFQAEIQQVLKEADTAMMEQGISSKDDENVPTALLESLAQKNNNGETDDSVSTDEHKATAESNLKVDTAQSSEESVDVDKEPSFISFLESTHDDNVAGVVDDDNAEVEEEKETEPAFVASLESSKSMVDADSKGDDKRVGVPVVDKQAPAVVAKTVPDVPSEPAKDVKPTEQATNPSIVTSPVSSSETVVKAKSNKAPTVKDPTVSKQQPIVANRAVEIEVSNEQPHPTITTVSKASTAPRVLNDAPRKVPQEAATSFRIKAPSSHSDALPVVEKPKVATQPTQQVISSMNEPTKVGEMTSTIPVSSLHQTPVKETVTTVSTPTATISAHKTTTPSAPKSHVVSTTVATDVSSSPPVRPQSTRDIMRSISTKPTMTRSANGDGGSVATKQRRTTTTSTQRQGPRQPVKPEIMSSIPDDGDDDSLKTSLSMLTRKEPSPGLEADYETAMNSLHQHIQNQARDMTRNMTRKKMDEKAGTMDESVPAFIAPSANVGVASPNKVSTIHATSIASEPPTPKQDTTTNSASEEQVAKMLKRSNASPLKRARKSVALAVMTTGVVMVGKRLAAVLIGRGIL